MLEEMGLRTAIPWYLDGFSKRSGVQTTLDLPAALTRMARDIELALFRVLQEALTNVHRHSESSTADVRVFIENGDIGIEVKDRGKGIPRSVLESADGSPGTLGVGVRGMRERVGQLGGKFDVISDENETIVRATIPVTC